MSHFLDEFQSIATAHPEKPGLVGESSNDTRSYGAVDKRSSQIGRFLDKKNIGRHDIVAILLPRSAKMIEAIYGIGKSGAAYLPIHLDSPKERIVEILKDSAAKAIVVDASTMSRAIELLVAVPTLQFYLSLDEETDTIPENNQDVSELWDFTVEQGNMQENALGWVDSYTKAPFTHTEVQEIADNVILKVAPFINDTTRVLEIGCGTGLIADRLLESVGSYVGVDISKKTTDIARANIAKKYPSADASFAVFEPKSFQAMTEVSFDLIVINSVVQFYPDLSYLLQILKKCRKLVKPGGAIFIGDIRDPDLQDDFYRSLPTAAENIDYVAMRRLSEQELFVPKNFFSLYCDQYLATCTVSTKEATVENELTRYRYDALIMAKTEAAPVTRAYYKNDVDQEQTETFCTAMQPTDIVYVIYTSGSTGKPKGVMIQYRSLVNRIDWMQDAYPLTSKDTVLLKTPYSFDVSVWEIFWWSRYGARLAVLPDGHERDPQQIIAAIASFDVTTIHFVPPMLDAFIDTVKHEIASPASDVNQQLSTLRRVFTSGEALRVSTAREFIEVTDALKSTASLHNLYGPTEATVDVSYFDCTRESLTDLSIVVPIGKPIANTRLYVLDDNLARVEEGVMGELYISGINVAAGYINNPTLTAQKFIDDPWWHDYKMYQSGDLVRVNEHGDIEYLGRIDRQVKIRGFRIELEEIEAAIRHFPGIVSTAVIVKGEGDEAALFAYVTATQSTDIPSLKKYLASLLPPYSVPVDILQIDKIPLTKHGKTDTAELQALLAQKESTAIHHSSDDAYAALGQLYESLLHRPIAATDYDESFFTLGGNSLLALRLLSNIEHTFQTTLSIGTFFEDSSVRAVFDKISNAATVRQASAPPSIAAAAELRPGVSYPTSHNQKRLYFLHLLKPESTYYNIVFRIDFSKPIDAAKLQAALNEVYHQHPGLRLNFFEEDGAVVQRLRTSDAVDFKTVQLKHSADTTELAYQMRQAPYDLAVDTLFSCTYVDQADRASLLLRMHHIICDARSLDIIAKEIIRTYNQCAYATTSVDVISYSIAEAAKDLALTDAYWRKCISAGVTPTTVPYDNERTSPVQDTVARASICLPQTLSRAILDDARANSRLVSAVFIAGISYVLSKYNNTPTVTMGLTLENRASGHVQDTIGFFANTLPVTVMVEEDVQVAELLRQVHRTLIDAIQHQDYPLDEIVRQANVSREGTNNPLFSLLYTHETQQPPLELEKGVTLLPREVINDVSDFDMTFTSKETSDGLTLSIKYNTALYEAATITRLLQTLHEVMDHMQKGGQTPVGELEYMSHAEAQMIQGFESGEQRVVEQQYLHSYIDESAKSHPDVVAIRDGNSTITYKELSRRTNQYARYLAEKGVGAGKIITIEMHKSVNAIVAIYATLKTGAAYLPIDPKLPPKRIATILNDAQPVMIISDTTVSATLHNIPVVSCTQLETLSSALSSEAVNLPPLTSDSIAYILYTSGSTGSPKGVIGTHVGINNTVDYMRRVYGPELSSVVPLSYSLSFDPSIGTMNLAFSQMKTLLVMRPEQLQDPAEIKRLVIEHNIRFAQFVPGILNYLDLKGTPIRAVASGTETISPHLVKKVQTYANFYYVYGPTEAAIFSTLWVGKRHTKGKIPIGPPIQNVSTYILDRSHKRVPIGAVGELFIATPSLAKGYLNNKDKTDAHFLRIPTVTDTVLYQTGDLAKWLPNGDIVHIGRTDYQVKHKGYRVELGEIQEKMLEINGIAEALVLIDTSALQDRLVAFYTRQTTVTEVDLNTKIDAYLLDTLPSYMIPNEYIALSKMPRRINGKIDRDALQIQSANSIANQPIEHARTAIGNIIAAVWEKVLGKAVDSSQSFFEVGGDSLAILQVMHLLHTEHEIQINAHELYIHQTISQLEYYLENRKVNVPDHAPIVTEEQSRPVPRELSPNLTYTDKCYIVTGATGYLGAYLVARLLNEPQTSVIALARPKGQVTAKQRVLDNVLSYNHIDSSRLEVVSVDITQSAELKEAVASAAKGRRIAGIHHCAANVNHVGSLSQFEDINVHATQAIIDAAEVLGQVPIYYASTLSVAGVNSQKVVFDESTRQVANRQFENNYEFTKFRAEAVIREYTNKHGGAIFRLGTVVAARKDAVLQNNAHENAFYSYLRAVMTSGVSLTSHDPRHINLSYVDECAEAMTTLISHYILEGHVFHIYNQHTVTARQIEDIMSRTIKQIAYLDAASDASQHDLRDISYISNYLAIGRAANSTIYSNEWTNGILGESSFHWSAPTDEYIQRVLKNLMHKEEIRQ